MTPNRSRIAVGAGLLALGGLTGAALSAGGQQKAAKVAARPPAIVRTEVIRQTIHRTRHEKPRPAPAAAPPPAVTPVARGVAVAATPASASASAPLAPAAAPRPPAAAAPVVHTRQSGAPGGTGGAGERGDDHSRSTKHAGEGQDD